jgi:hypothetical protein
VTTSRSGLPWDWTLLYLLAVTVFLAVLCGVVAVIAWLVRRYKTRGVRDVYAERKQFWLEEQGRRDGKVNGSDVGEPSIDDLMGDRERWQS